MAHCIICAHEATEAEGAQVSCCARCSAALTVERRQVIAEAAPAELQNEILDEIRREVARTIHGLPFERQLTTEEVQALLSGVPPTS